MDISARFDRYLGQSPRVHPTAFIAPGAVLVGDVTVGEEASIWYGCTLRGDINRIVVGPRSNVQDNSVVHLADDYGAYLGELVTVGHRAIIHACTVADEVLVGMGAVVMDGAEIGPRCIIGANALVTQHTKIPEGSLVLGSPAKVVKTLDLEAQRAVKTWAEKYVQVARRFREQPPISPYVPAWRRPRRVSRR